MAMLTRVTELPASLRRLLLAGLSLLLLGILSSLGSESTFSGALAALGFVLTTTALHKLGRLGPSRVSSRFASENHDRDIAS